MKKIFIIALVILTSFLIVYCSDDDTKEEPKVTTDSALIGVWKQQLQNFTSVVMLGNKINITENEITFSSMIPAGTTYTPMTLKASYTLDPEKSPKQINFTITEKSIPTYPLPVGYKFEGIYSIGVENSITYLTTVADSAGKRPTLIPNSLAEVPTNVSLEATSTYSIRKYFK